MKNAQRGKKKNLFSPLPENEQHRARDIHEDDANSTFMKAFGILGIFPKKNPYRKRITSVEKAVQLRGRGEAGM